MLQDEHEASNLNVIGSVKIDPNHSGTEIHFIGEHYSLTFALARNA